MYYNKWNYCLGVISLCAEILIIFVYLYNLYYICIAVCEI